MIDLRKYRTKAKKILIMLSLLLLVLFFTCSGVTSAMHYYEKVDFVTGLVTATTLNVRSGPSTKYPSIAKVNKGEYVRVFAKVGNFYVIQTDDDHIGAASKDYIKAIYPGSNDTGGGNTGSGNTSMTAEEQETLRLINEERKKQGLAALTMDKEAQNVAKIKAQDMVDNNYFSHTSPTYGDPFTMLKKFKVSYKAAGENLAGNSTPQRAVSAWMNSEGHRANILNGSFNYTGIGVVNSKQYGKIFVQIFIGK